MYVHCLQTFEQCGCYINPTRSVVKQLMTVDQQCTSTDTCPQTVLGDAMLAGTSLCGTMCSVPCTEYIYETQVTAVGPWPSVAENATSLSAILSDLRPEDSQLILSEYDEVT